MKPAAADSTIEEELQHEQPTRSFAAINPALPASSRQTRRGRPPSRKQPKGVNRSYNIDPDWTDTMPPRESEFRCPPSPAPSNASSCSSYASSSRACRSTGRRRGRRPASAAERHGAGLRRVEVVAGTVPGERGYGLADGIRNEAESKVCMTNILKATRSGRVPKRRRIGLDDDDYDEDQQLSNEEDRIVWDRKRLAEGRLRTSLDRKRSLLAEHALHSPEQLDPFPIADPVASVMPSAVTSSSAAMPSGDISSANNSLDAAHIYPAIEEELDDAASMDSSSVSATSTPGSVSLSRVTDSVSCAEIAGASKMESRGPGNFQERYRTNLPIPTEKGELGRVQRGFQRGFPDARMELPSGMPTHVALQQGSKEMTTYDSIPDQRPRSPQLSQSSRKQQHGFSSVPQESVPYSLTHSRQHQELLPRGHEQIPARGGGNDDLAQMADSVSFGRPTTPIRNQQRPNRRGCCHSCGQALPVTAASGALASSISSDVTPAPSVQSTGSGTVTPLPSSHATPTPPPANPSLPLGIQSGDQCTVEQALMDSLQEEEHHQRQLEQNVCQEGRSQAAYAQSCVGQRSATNVGPSSTQLHYNSQHHLPSMPPVSSRQHQQPSMTPIMGSLPQFHTFFPGHQSAPASTIGRSMYCSQPSASHQTAPMPVNTDPQRFPSPAPSPAIFGQPHISAQPTANTPSIQLVTDQQPTTAAVMPTVRVGSRIASISGANLQSLAAGQILLMHENSTVPGQPDLVHLYVLSDASLAPAPVVPQIITAAPTVVIPSTNPTRSFSVAGNLPLSTGSARTLEVNGTSNILSVPPVVQPVAQRALVDGSLGLASARTTSKLSGEIVPNSANVPPMQNNAVENLGDSLFLKPAQLVNLQRDVDVVGTSGSNVDNPETRSLSRQSRSTACNHLRTGGTSSHELGFSRQSEGMSRVSQREGQNQPGGTGMEYKSTHGNTSDQDNNAISKGMCVKKSARLTQIGCTNSSDQLSVSRGRVCPDPDENMRFTATRQNEDSVCQDNVDGAQMGALQRSSESVSAVPVSVRTDMRPSEARQRENRAKLEERIGVGLELRRDNLREQDVGETPDSSSDAAAVQRNAAVQKSRLAASDDQASKQSSESDSESSRFGASPGPFSAPCRQTPARLLRLESLRSQLRPPRPRLGSLKDLRPSAFLPVFGGAARNSIAGVQSFVNAVSIPAGISASSTKSNTSSFLADQLPDVPMAKPEHDDDGEDSDDKNNDDDDDDDDDMNNADDDTDEEQVY